MGYAPLPRHPAQQNEKSGLLNVIVENNYVAKYDLLIFIMFFLIIVIVFTNRHFFRLKQPQIPGWIMNIQANGSLQILCLFTKAIFF